MPQSPISDLVVTNAGTIFRQVDTIQFTGDGVTVTPGSPNPRVAVVNISGGGGGGSYTAGLGTYITNAGSYSIIGNTGTIEQPTATGTNNGLGILLQASNGSAAGGRAGRAGLYGGAGTNAEGGYVLAQGGVAIITSASNAGQGGSFNGTAGYAYYSNWVAGGAAFGNQGGYINGAGTAVGGHGLFGGGTATGAPINTGGGAEMYGGNGSTQGGDVTITPGTGAINGVLVVNTLGTIDPHNYNAVFQSATANLLGYYPLYRSRG
jgi:hypothetical protein